MRRKPCPFLFCAEMWMGRCGEERLGQRQEVQTMKGGDP